MWLCSAGREWEVAHGEGSAQTSARRFSVVRLLGARRWPDRHGRISGLEPRSLGAGVATNLGICRNGAAGKEVDATPGRALGKGGIQGSARGRSAADGVRGNGRIRVAGGGNPG